VKLRCRDCQQYGHESCAGPHNLLRLGEAVPVDEARAVLLAMSLNRAAVRLGVSRGVARRWARLLGIPVRMGPRGPRRARG
jgi:hypothetical protein